MCFIALLTHKSMHLHSNTKFQPRIQTSADYNTKARALTQARTNNIKQTSDTYSGDCSSNAGPPGIPRQYWTKKVQAMVCVQTCMPYKGWMYRHWGVSEGYQLLPQRSFQTLAMHLKVGVCCVRDKTCARTHTHSLTNKQTNKRQTHANIYTNHT